MFKNKAIKNSINGLKTLLIAGFIFTTSFLSVKLIVENKNTSLKIIKIEEKNLAPPPSLNTRSILSTNKGLTEKIDIKATKEELIENHHLEIKKITLALNEKKLFDNNKENKRKQKTGNKELKKLPETSLDLILISSIIASDKEQSVATIAHKKNQYHYKVNQSIRNEKKVKLIAILGDGIILNNKGQLEKLMMYPRSNKRNRSDRPFTEEQPYYDEKNEEDHLLLSLNDAGLNPSEKLAIINQRLNGMEDILKLSVKNENGRLIGFNVIPGNNRAAFDRSELKANDIITAIDGTELNNIRVAQQTWEEKRYASQVDLTVMRGDNLAVVSIDLNDL